MLFLQRIPKAKRATPWIKTATVIVLCACSPTLFADTHDKKPASKRVEVYSLSQNYWDTLYGDTLGEIAHHLLPNNPSKRVMLQQDILHLNPGAFIGGDPAKLLAGKRLRMPGYMKQADSKADPATTTIETYSWGNIKRQKE